MKIWHNSWGYQAELEQNSGAYLADLWISGFPHREFWKPVRWMLWLGFGLITKQAEIMGNKGKNEEFQHETRTSTISIDYMPYYLVNHSNTHVEIQQISANWITE